MYDFCKSILDFKPAAKAEPHVTANYKSKQRGDKMRRHVPGAPCVSKCVTLRVYYLQIICSETFCRRHYGNIRYGTPRRL